MITIDRATTYTILPGQSNFRPLENPKPRRCSGFEVAFRFAPSCWWSVEDWEGDKDREDWNKLKGLTYFFSANNRCSAMIAWRPADDMNVFEVTAYTNDKKGGWEVTGQPVRIYAGEVCYARCYLGPRWIEYEVEYFGVKTRYAHAWNRPWLKLFREIGTSIGGANNAEGPYGGEATQPMEMEIAFQTI